MLLESVSIISKGPAKGHGIFIDDNFLNDLVVLANRKGKIKVRFGHPAITEDSIGTELGYASGFYRDDDRVRADILFIETEYNKAMVDHVLAYAEAAPDSFGLSIEFSIVESESNLLDEETGLRIVKLDDIQAVAFVSDPAANPDGVFSRKGKGVFNSILSFFSMNIFKKKQQKKNTIQLGERTLIDGVLVLFPGEEPAVGDLLQVVVDGEPVPAPEGTHQTMEGELITVDVNGIITEVSTIEPEVEETPSPSEDVSVQLQQQQNEIIRLKAQLNQLYKQQQQLRPSVQAQSFAPTSFNVNRHIEQNASQVDREDREWFDMLKEAYRLQRLGVQSKNLVIRKDKSTAAWKKFATGTDFSTAPARQIPYMMEVLKEMLGSDNVLGVARNIAPEVPNGDSNLYRVRLPKMVFNANTYDLWRVPDPYDCGFNPEGELVSSQRELVAHPLNFEYEVCAKDWRNLWDGLLWINERELPTRINIVMMLMEKLLRGLQYIFWFGKGPIDGLLQRICDEMTALCIPASQVVPWIATNDTNAIARLKDLLNSTPAGMIGMDNVVITTPQNYEDYRNNYLNVHNFSWGQLVRDQLNILDQERIPETRVRASWSASWEALQENPGLSPLGNDPWVLTQWDNVAYLLEESSYSRGFEVWYDQNTQLHRFRWETFFGVDIVDCSRVVASINC